MNIVLQPTNPTRGWFVPVFGGNPWWVYLASALPALLVTILVFMDQQITAVIVNRKEHKLKVSPKPAWFKTMDACTFSTTHLYRIQITVTLQLNMVFILLMRVRDVSWESVNMNCVLEPVTAGAENITM